MIFGVNKVDLVRRAERETSKHLSDASATSPISGWINFGVVSYNLPFRPFLLMSVVSSRGLPHCCLLDIQFHTADFVGKFGCWSFSHAIVCTDR